MTIQMFDSINPATVPSVASTSHDAVAGYVDGRWPDFQALERLFPKAHHLSIAVTAADDADCLDIETGDAVPSEAAGWVRRQHARGVARPCLYANVSEMPAVKANLDDAGLSRGSYRLWAAHWTYDLAVATAELANGWDAIQWTNKAQGRDLDESVCVDSFFGQVTPPRKPAKPARKHRIPVKKLKKVLPKKPHPKVVSGSLAGGVAAALITYLRKHGVHLSDLEAGGLDLAVIYVIGYYTPARKPPAA